MWPWQSSSQAARRKHLAAELSLWCYRNLSTGQQALLNYVRVCFFLPFSFATVKSHWAGGEGRDSRIVNSNMPQRHILHNDGGLKGLSCMKRGYKSVFGCVLTSTSPAYWGQTSQCVCVCAYVRWKNRLGCARLRPPSFSRAHGVLTIIHCGPSQKSTSPVTRCLDLATPKRGAPARVEGRYCHANKLA